MLVSHTHNERGLTMLLHSALIGFVMYFAMTIYNKNPFFSEVAENRAILVAAISVIYMIMFGHKLPPSDLSKWWATRTF